VFFKKFKNKIEFKILDNTFKKFKMNRDIIHSYDDIIPSLTILSLGNILTIMLLALTKSLIELV
jgi:hypothetical protein